MIKVSQNLESISIETSDADLFFELQALIKRNFAKTLGQKGKVMSFYDENEKVQRKYFVKFLKKLCQRYELKNVNLNFAEYKTIKLHYIQPNSLKAMVFVDVAFVRGGAIFSFDRSNESFISHIIRGFESKQILSAEGQIALNIANLGECARLEELFNKSEYMKFSIIFNYNEEEFEKFKKRIKICAKKNEAKFAALTSLFEDHFAVLGCDKNDSFEEVRNRYLELVKAYHPDFHAALSPELLDECKTQFQRIQNAYESLKPYFKELEAGGGVKNGRKEFIK